MRSGFVLAVLAMLTSPATLAAQPSSPSRFALGASVGPALTTAGDGHTSPLGIAGSLVMRWSATHLLSVTIEGLASRFGVSSDHVHAPCPPEAGPFGCHPPTGPLSVGALGAGIQWADSAVAVGDRGSYLLLGGGLYHALNHPTARGATRLGWTAGFGFVLKRGTPRVSLEIRYHQIPRWPEDRISLIHSRLRCPGKRAIPGA